MSFSDKIKDVAYVNGFKQFLRRGSNGIFVASIVNISTFNKDVLDSEVTLCDCRKEQGHQAVVSSWMVNMETSIGYKGGLAEALSTRYALLIQVIAIIARCAGDSAE